MIEPRLLAFLMPPPSFATNARVAMLSALPRTIAMAAVAALTHGEEGCAPLTGKNVAFDLTQSKIV